MTFLEATALTPTDATRAHQSRARDWRALVAIIVVPALAVAGGTVAVVHALDAAALTQVHVFLDARPVTCADPDDITTVPAGSGIDDNSYRVPAVKGAVGLNCVLSVVSDRL